MGKINPELKRVAMNRMLSRGGGGRMDGNYSAYDPHDEEYSPYGDNPYSRSNGGRQMAGAQTQNRMSGGRMGGEGYYVWNGMGASPMRDNVTNMNRYNRQYSQGRMSMHDGMKSKGHEQEKGRIGFRPGKNEGQHLSKEKAEQWVDSMEDEDGGKGGKWSYEDVCEYAKEIGITDDEMIVDFYAMINALYTDYCTVAEKYGVNNVDFYTDMAIAFINDPDAQDGKVKKYYDCIAKHDDKEEDED